MKSGTKKGEELAPERKDGFNSTRNNLINVFKNIGIDIYPAGTWKFISKIKAPIDAMRKDTTKWSKYPKDNMAKYRPEKTQHYVVDFDMLDRIKEEMSAPLFKKCMSTFGYQTTSKQKRHAIFEFEGTAERRTNHYTGLDLLPSGIVFTGHLFNDPKTKFKIFPNPVLKLSQKEADELEKLFNKLRKKYAPAEDVKAMEAGNSWVHEIAKDKHVPPIGHNFTMKQIMDGALEQGTRVNCPFGAEHSDGKNGQGYGFISSDNGIGCNSCQKILIAKDTRFGKADEFGDEVEKEKKRKKKKKKKGFDAFNVPGVLTEKLIEERGQQLAFFPGIVVDRMHSFIYSAAGMGKTTLFGWIAAQILKEHEESKVIFWSFDTTQDHETAIFEYVKSQGVEDRFKLSVESTGDDYLEWTNECLDSETDLTGFIVIIDTFKNITKNVNDKNANKDAMHKIKALLKLGATVVSLGHSNKDGIKHSGTAEIEQDSDAVLVMNREVNELTGQAIISIEKAGRVRFNSPGVSFKMHPEGTDFDYHSSTLASLEMMNEIVDLKTKAEIKEKEDKAKKLREARFATQAEKDANDIAILCDGINYLNDHKKQIPIKTALEKYMNKEHDWNHKKTERMLERYHGKDWLRVPYIKEDKRRVQIYETI